MTLSKYSSIYLFLYISSSCVRIRNSAKWSPGDSDEWSCHLTILICFFYGGVFFDDD